MANFITAFQEWVGETEAPPIYFKWSALSLIAACVSSRVSVGLQLGARTIQMPPNLYLLLLGPSGNGKSLAASAALGLLRGSPTQHQIVNVFAGKLTAPAMYEHMLPTKKHPEHPFIYVVNDELANDIGMGEYAEQFVKSLTRLYLGEHFSDYTVTRGLFTIAPPYCVNWLACTTQEWLGHVVKRDAILGGFFARTVVISAGYTGVKVVEPKRPPNWEGLDRFLATRVEWMLQLKGEYKLTDEAKEVEKVWYETRPVPSEGDAMSPTYKRERGLVLKLALLVAVARGSNYVIEREHVEEAIRLVTEASTSIPELAANTSPQERELLSLLRVNKCMSHETLALEAWRKGVTARQVRELVETWQGAGLVKVEGGQVKWNS